MYQKIYDEAIAQGADHEEANLIALLAVAFEDKGVGKKPTKH